VADDFATLDDYIARIRALPELGRRAAPAVAQAVELELKRQIAAGVDPDGKSWQPTEDGRKPLETAAAALTVGAQGSTVIMRLHGHIARHHRGRVRGGVVRRILPTSAIPAPMIRVIHEVLADEFREVMHG